MHTKLFYSEDDRVWSVRKTGVSFSVSGAREEDEKLHDIARSCAFRLGITSLNNGTPLEHINQHQRIWNLIWHRGEPT